MNFFPSRFSLPEGSWTSALTWRESTSVQINFSEQQMRGLYRSLYREWPLTKPQPRNDGVRLHLESHPTINPSFSRHLLSSDLRFDIDVNGRYTHSLPNKMHDRSTSYRCLNRYKGVLFKFDVVEIGIFREKILSINMASDIGEGTYIIENVETLR